MTDSRQPSHRSDLREILVLAIPAMLAQASLPLLNIGETAMIGRLSAEALAARAVGAALIGTVYWLFAFLTFGTTSLIGHHYGAGDSKACGETYLHALFVALTGGLFIACAGALFAEPLYQLMGAEAAVAAQGANYFRIYIASAPFTLTIYCSVGFYRGIQNTTVPMVMAFAITAIQLTLDYGLIYGRLGLPALGLTGAAVAAWCAQLIGAMTYFGLFFYSPRTAVYCAIPWRITSAGLRPLFRIGQDLAIRTGALRLSLIFATSTAARMGTATLSAYEIVFQLFMLCSDVIDGLAIAGQALVAKYLGSGEKARAYRMGVTLTLCGITAGLLFAVSFAIAWATIVEFFTTSVEVIALLTPGATILVCLIQPLNGAVFVLDGLLIGARDTRYLMWAMVGGAMIMIPLAWSARQFDLGLPGILLAIAALMAWRAATNVSRFVNQAWMRGR
ncbi:MAG TPA: MATE family efflux transporter [Candidatus Deferrimicrobium sp.]|nr:MATE family efflux transporter [Candidatus Deferrimicrobium sp.]